MREGEGGVEGLGWRRFNEPCLRAYSVVGEGFKEINKGKISLQTPHF